MEFLEGTFYDFTAKQVVPKRPDEGYVGSTPPSEVFDHGFLSAEPVNPRRIHMNLERQLVLLKPLTMDPSKRSCRWCDPTLVAGVAGWVAGSGVVLTPK